ncbi:hypothetical protein AQUCO_00200814v1 [Aquilegia coerulea]|uniref:EF-hand domain-containing protein n=1 Tax=Aquilegia coerulea TaxID=218851 RepID=A0A2G5F4S8_AQUCA|nr:hypothetical protein AQUCO_00200814v1 [Aquilegia coerulea]
MPLIEFSHKLVDRGFKITFVNTEVIHERVVAALSNKGQYEEFINLVPIPDGLGAEEDRHFEIVKLLEIMGKVMPGHLENLIQKINESNNDDDRITCIISDLHMPWAFEVAKKMSIPSAAFWPASAVLLALYLHIPKLIDDGIITADGDLIKNQMVLLSPTMPAMSTAEFSWLCLGQTVALQKAVFNLMFQIPRAVKLADFHICNSFSELEPSGFSLIPNLKPIGPLFASSRLAHFWPEDSSCLSWLDQQPARSVIYVAFGSITVMDKQQFDELALGLELCGQPFLWVVRPDLVNGVTGTYPDGFEARVAARGRLVGWAPQREVLAHPSVACFFSHCGWNSTMEGVSNGLPFLCWPYFADQILNKSYICDVWKIGLGLDPDENGLISKEEIKSKLTGLLGDEGIKGRTLKLKETGMNNVNIGGASSLNFEDFVQAIQVK